MASSKVTVCIGLCFLSLFIWSSNSVNAATKGACDPKQQPISRIIFSFCSKLVKEIGGEENFFFSPLSISAALAMLYVGTAGTTERQMSTALQYYIEGEGQCLKSKISKEFRTLIESLEYENDDVLALLIANGIFVHLHYTVSADYISRLQKYFKADVKYLDFTNEEKLSLKNINDWISERTDGMVPQLLNEPLDPLTVMVILNAMYFKGLWEAPFSENDTNPDTFYGRNDNRKTVPFMTGEASLNYYFDEDTNNHFLDMYYFGSNMSMLLVLPANVRDFPTFELNGESLCMLKGNLEQRDVHVILPKFRMEYKRELSKDMMNMGLGELFSDRANLSGIRNESDLHVSLMVHKAVIEVDEEGTRASAVSGIGIDARRKPSDHVTLVFDHPFLFYIINKELNLVLFAGRVVDPEI